jgi:hypothetical protein
MNSHTIQSVVGWNWFTEIRNLMYFRLKLDASKPRAVG